jgi:sarcosine oxidase subunit gamma
MLERRSALATATPYASPVLEMGEVRSFTLTQAAGSHKVIAEIARDVPEKVGIARECDGRTIFRIGPQQVWFVGPEPDDIAAKLRSVCAVTPLSHSRTRIFLDGPPARDVLAKGIPLDFHERVFTPGSFALTGLHHMPVLVHCVSANRFELYALRSYAMSVWDWLTDAALEFAS